MVTPLLISMLLLGPVDIARDLRHFGEFRKIFRPNIGQDQTKFCYLNAEPVGLCHMVIPVLIIALRL